MRIKKKMVSVVVAVSLVTGCLIGGTLAWLTDRTDEVKNTFVAGEIGDLTLTETDEDRTYIIVPGVEITKDPTITFNYKEEIVDGTNRPAYVFVTVSDADWTYDEDDKKFSSNAADGSDDNVSTDDVKEGAMTWTVDANWTYLCTDSGKYVFYKEINPANDLDQEGKFVASIIQNNSISVNAELVTETNIAKLAEAVSGLTFQGYAIQKEAIKGENGVSDEMAAWNLLKQ